MHKLTKILLVALPLLGGIMGGIWINANAERVDYGRDCDKFAVIRCGTHSTAELQAEYDSLGTHYNRQGNRSTQRQADIQAIFSHLGISRADLNKPLVSGIVHKNGTVTVNGKVVARNAHTAIRGVKGAAIPGSSSARYVPASRMGSAQGALVHINGNGQFEFAVMTPCGNPVRADNVVPAPPAPQPTPKPTPVPPKPQPKDIVVCRLSDKKYPVTIKENEFDPKLHSTNPNDCKEAPKPIATCDNLSQPVITNRSTVTMTAHASVQNGATISGYVFTVTGPNGYKRQAVVNSTATTAQVTMTFETAGAYHVAVTVRTSVGDQTSAACQKHFTIAAEPQLPAISITKTANGVKYQVVEVDQPFTYEIKVTNTGNVALKNATITDLAPEGVSFRSAAQGTINNNQWRHMIPELKVGASQQFTITAVVTKQATDRIVNTACVDTPTIPGDSDGCDKATVGVKIKACNTKTGVIESVAPGKENTVPYTTDLTKCDKITVCDLTSKTIVSVTKHEAQDTTRYVSVNHLACTKPVTPPQSPEPTPPVLPQTGTGAAIIGTLGLGTLVTAGMAYMLSRRGLHS